MKRKILSLCLLAVFTLSLHGCSGEALEQTVLSATVSSAASEKPSPRPTTKPTPTPTPTPEPTPEPTPQAQMVWIPTNGGAKYHRKATCSGMKSPVQVTLEEAEWDGFEPCKRCY